jgi:tRNA threonylcarbamoyladenosine biosynthesis protein TsaE
LALAGRLGGKLKGGEVIELIGDLGSGKTAFVKGMAAGMGSKDQVSSPSFTLSNQYRAKKLSLYHFDFYRLDEPGILEEELREVVQDDKAVVVIEWPQIVEADLPAERLIIHIKVLSENSRQFTFNYPQKLSDIVESLK